MFFSKYVKCKQFIIVMPKYSYILILFNTSYTKLYLIGKHHFMLFYCIENIIFLQFPQFIKMFFRRESS